jgi:CelD/BcsL family acetyltransferase involved in cellulose biosynthesis
MTEATCKVSADELPTSCVVSIHRGGARIVDELADEWRSLCSRSEDDQPFYRPEWIAAYLRAFAPQAKVLIVTARIDGRLCLLLPLLEEKTTLSGVPVRRLRAPVNSHPGRFDFALSPGIDGDAAIKATWQHLRDLNTWDVIEIRDTLQGSSAGRLTATARADEFQTVQVPELPNAYVRLPEDPAEWKHIPHSAKLRSRLRQARRLLGEKGTLKFNRVVTADREALDSFYQLEASGWKGREGSAIACRPETRQFYDEIAECGARFGYLSLYMLKLSGQLIAAHFSLEYRRRCYSPRIAYDEKFRQFRPGHLIFAEILQDCAARGIHGFDITGPNDEWKMDWATEVLAVNHHFIFNKGVMGRLAYGIRFRLRPAIRRLLFGWRATVNRVHPGNTAVHPVDRALSKALIQ